MKQFLLCVCVESEGNTGNRKRGEGIDVLELFHG